MNMVSEPDGRSVGRPGPARYSVNEMSILPKNGASAKADGLYGERRSQGTGGISCLQEMERCGLCLDETRWYRVNFTPLELSKGVLYF